MSEWEQLYNNWLQKLEALQEVSDQHDFTPEGDSAFQIAFLEAKQAYHLLCDIPMEAAAS